MLDMTSEALLNNLIKVQSNPIKYMDLLNDTINKLKIDVYNENLDAKNRKNDPAKKALAYLKKGGKFRPVLKKSDFQEICGVMYQVFTDSYTAFMLKSPLPLPRVGESENFPQINKIVPDIKGGELSNANIKEVLAKLKAKQLETHNDAQIYTFKTESYECTIDAERLKTVCDILNTTALKVRVYGNARPILIIDESTDNRAIICALRVAK